MTPQKFLKLHSEVWKIKFCIEWGECDIFFNYNPTEPFTVSEFKNNTKTRSNLQELNDYSIINNKNYVIERKSE